MLPSLGLSVFINGDSRKQIKSKISPSYNSQSTYSCHSQNDVFFQRLQGCGDRNEMRGQDSGEHFAFAWGGVSNSCGGLLKDDGEGWGF